MLQDIAFKKVEDIGMAVLPQSYKEGEVWDVYLLNFKHKAIHSVLIRSTGYGTQQGREVKTSVLRQFFEKVAPREYRKIEVIKENLVGLYNEFWISFRYQGHMYDKKYVFVPDSLSQQYLTFIPLLDSRGVIIK